MKKKAICFWGVLSLFILISCWWMTYFPYNRALLYRAIPMSSDIIIEQPELADHWRNGAVKDFVIDILSAKDSDGVLLTAIREDKHIDQILAAVASRNTLIASVPSISPEIKPAIVIATWAGSKGQFLKWGAGLYSKPYAEHAKCDYGVDMWSVDLGEGDLDYRYLSCSFFEGVLVVCLSHQQFGINYIVDRMIFARPLAPALQKHLEKDQTADAGWVISQGSKMFGTQSFSYSFTRDLGKGISGRLVWGEGNPFRMTSAVADYAQNCGEAVDILAKAPGAVVFAPYHFFESQMISIDKTSKLSALRKIFRGIVKEETPVFLCLCSSDYSGKMRGFKVPSFLLGMKIQDASRFPEFVSASLDALNSAYKTNLIATESNINGHMIYTIDRVTGKFFEGMSQKEKPAIGLIGEWLIVASNAEVLRNLIEMDSASIIGSAMDFDESICALWLNLPELDSTVVNMIALNDLWSIAVQKPRHTEFRMIMSALQYSLRALSGMETCVLSTENKGDETSLRIKIK